MEEGSIHLSSSIAPVNTATNNIINNVVHIYLDVPSHAVISSEEINLIASENNTNQENIKDSIKDSIKDNIEISSGMKLLLNQKLLETMGGKLEIIASPITTAVTQDCSRLQIAIPLVTPEAELLQSE